MFETKSGSQIYIGCKEIDMRARETREIDLLEMISFWGILFISLGGDCIYFCPGNLTLTRWLSYNGRLNGEKLVMCSPLPKYP